MPCIAGLCDADNARARLASGVEMNATERADLEIAARGCLGPQSDPWVRDLRWDECPAKAAMKHPDVDAALTVKGLAAVSPIAGWPDSISGRVVETIAAINGERAASRAPVVQDG